MVIRRWCVITAMVIAIGATAHAVDLDFLQVRGTFMGMTNVLSQGSARRGGFDYALNLDLGYDLTTEWAFYAQFQTGPGGGVLGFAGPNTVITDVGLTFQVPDLALTLGSFDTPFGLGTELLSNNGDGFANPVMVNSLMYGALGGPVGTLNTLGIKVDWKQWGIDWTGCVNNGTGETAASGDDHLGWLVGGAMPVADTGWTVAGSYMSSDDRADAGIGGSTSFAADFSGWLADASYQSSAFVILGNVGSLRYDDHNSGTADDVSVGMAQGTWFVTPWFFTAAQWSFWRPTDADANGSHALLPNPGYGGFDGLAIATDQRVERYQIGIGYLPAPVVLMKAVILKDDYQTASDVWAVLGSLNLSF